MWVVRRGCQEIMELHKGRQTESFYEKMLACYLYERGIPYMTQAMFGLRCAVLKVARDILRYIWPTALSLRCLSVS